MGEVGSRSDPGEGLWPIEGPKPPHPNPLPNGEREHSAIATAASTIKIQNGISSSMSADLPAPAMAGLRSRDTLGPLEPKSSPLSALAPPPPRVSSIVSCELKPCSTTSVEYLSWPSLSVHLRV